jgi:hypothetical protein
MMGHKDCVSFLLKSNAAVDMTCDLGDTALHHAVNGGQTFVMMALIHYGAVINAKNSNGRTALHCAALKGHKECVDCLLKHGAIVDQADDQGCTPLYLAAWHGFREIVAALILSGADVEKVDFTRKPASSNIIFFGRFKAANLLLESRKAALRNSLESSFIARNAPLKLFVASFGIFALKLESAAFFVYDAVICLSIIMVVIVYLLSFVITPAFFKFIFFISRLCFQTIKSIWMHSGNNRPRSGKTCKENTAAREMNNTILARLQRLQQTSNLKVLETATI